MSSEPVVIRRQFYTVAEVARITGYSPDYVRQAALARLIPAKVLKLGGRYTYRFPRRPFDAWWNAGGTEILGAGQDVQLEVRE